MSSQEYKNIDKLEQEQLEIIHALIEDATKDTALWLQDDPSAEERVHVLAIQTGLADLARIIERRMERRELPPDEWEYSETVSDVLSRLNKARKLRGNIIVGRALGRLTERLPQELVGSKGRSVTQAPAPPHDWHEELRQARDMEDDFGFLTFGPAWDAVRMLAQANDPIDQEKRIDSLWRMYPDAAKKLCLPKLPASSQSQVKPAASSSVESQANRWRAFRNEFDQLAGEEERIERAAPKDRFLRAYCSYREHPEVWEKGKVEQGCFCLLKAPETGLWTLGDGVSENFLERFRALAAHAGVALGSPEGTDPEDFWLHRLWLDLRENQSDQLFAASKEGGVILRVSKASATFCSRLERKTVTEAGRLRTGEKQADSLRAQNRANSAQSTSPGAWTFLAAAPYLHKLIACLAVEPADLWPEYGEAAPYVKQLAEIMWNQKVQWNMAGDALEEHHERDELLQIIRREYPDVARKLDLPLVEAIPERGADTAEGKSTDAAVGAPKDEKVHQGNAVAEFGDVLTAIGGRHGGLDLKRSLLAEQESWIRRAVPKHGNRGGRHKGKPRDHRAMVEAYIEEGRTKGKRITKKDIWTAAGYRTRTEFERWERQDPKRPNKAADKNFTRVLREKPHLK